MGGDLRRVCLRGHEVVQRIYIAVRDQYWRTIPLRIAGREVTQDDSGFTIACDLICDDPLVRYQGHLEMRGLGDGQLELRFFGIAGGAFQRMRLGLCVLHPQQLAGSPLLVGHAPDEIENSALPTDLAPEVVATAIRWLETGPTEARVRLHFSGDQFEMEDQRNYGDASFKTYSTLSALPRPVWVAEGEQVQQALTLVPCATVGNPPSLPASNMVRLVVEDTVQPLARLGFLEGDTASVLSPTQHRLVALDLSSAWRERLAAAEQARASDGATTLITVQAAQLTAANAAALAGLLPPDSEILVYDAADEAPLSLLRSLVRAETVVGHGTGGPFILLNRGPRLRSAALGFAVNPLTHADDSWSLLENSAALAHLARSARHLQAPLRIGPVMVPAEDQRQTNDLGATWLVAALAHLLPELTADDAVTLAPQAVLHAGASAAVLQALTGITGLLPVRGNGQRVVGLASTTPTGRRVLLANLDHQPTSVIISGLRQGVEAVHLAGWAWARVEG